MANGTKLDKKRIVQNTGLLYVRMLLTMLIGLYTSRVILTVLGISDYGIYNVVGGIVYTLAFLNSAMAAASQRFISYELGIGNMSRLKRIFSTSVNIHMLIAFIIFIGAETIGLWFVNTHLNIEDDRMVAANWVYQFSIFTLMLSIWSVPYNSCIVAHEHMKAFAYISFFESVSKLIIVYCLSIGTSDRLILYGILVFVVTLLVRLCYGIYCKRHFEECSYHFVWDKRLFKDMFSFAGWSILGNLGFSFKDSVGNIILNIFFGTAINAARGIAMQVSSLITTFSTNFAMALNPQITKQYAAGNVEESRSLVYAGARYSFYLLMLITIPFLINSDYILWLWLSDVPEYTGIFIALALFVSLLHALSGTVTTALQATGYIKVFQIGISMLMLSEIPVAYILLRAGMPPYAIMYPTLVTYTLAVFFRFCLLKRMIPSYDFTYYVFHVFLKSVFLFIVCYFLCDKLHDCFENSFLTVIITVFMSLCIIIVTIYFIGITPIERVVVRKRIVKFLKCD